MAPKSHIASLCVRALLVIFSFAHLIVLCLTKPYNYWGYRGDPTGVFALGIITSIVTLGVCALDVHIKGDTGMGSWRARICHELCISTLWGASLITEFITRFEAAGALASVQLVFSFTMVLLIAYTRARKRKDHRENVHYSPIDSPRLDEGSFEESRNPKDSHVSFAKSPETEEARGLLS